MTVEAKKLYATGQGAETAAPMAETLWIGGFTAKPGNKIFGQNNVLAYVRRPVRSGTQTITFVTDRAPKWVGVDPYNEVIDRNSDDNLVEVK